MPLAGTVVPSPPLTPHVHAHPKTSHRPKPGHRLSINIFSPATHSIHITWPTQAPTAHPDPRPASDIFETEKGCLRDAIRERSPFLRSHSKKGFPMSTPAQAAAS